MKLLACPALALALLVSSAAFLPPSAFAQEGPIRQRLQERWMARQQQNNSHDAGAQTNADKITKAGEYTFTIRHDGLTRMYRVHVPAQYNPAAPAPLLFALHGGGGNMDYQANDTYYGLIAKSEQAGFVAVFPNGYSKLKSGKFATWNAGTCCGGARDTNVDDVGFIREIVGRLTRQMNIDRQRIFATGMSNGGLMAYRLACEASDIFTAIAPVAGTDNTRSCHPQHPVSVLHIHARNDSHVLFTGGAGPGTRNESMVTSFTSVPDTIAKWVRLNGCSVTPQRILGKAGAYCEAYSSCRGSTQVRLCVTESGDHSWPGGHKPRGDEPPSQALSANDVMWDFFNRR